DDLTAAIKIADRGGSYSSERLASIYVHRGLLRWNAEKIDLAIADYSRAIELDPEDWEAYFHRWQAYNHHDEPEKAELDREHGMKLKPSVFKKEYVLRYDGIVLN
ncbi:MAG: tetratricopeptide repeat protein, partial [Planctomycetaceae bacterium]|nr:tetratricopeptide repeat protein [Planctomycetaceae bacterium]